MDIKGFPPEEPLICDWLLKELADAQSWEQIHVIMRALANVRRLGEEERTKHSAIVPPHLSRAPVPTLPPPRSGIARAQISRAQLPPQERVVDGTENLELDDGLPWENNPDTM